VARSTVRRDLGRRYPRRGGRPRCCRRQPPPRRRPV